MAVVCGPRLHLHADEPPAVKLVGSPDDVKRFLADDITALRKALEGPNVLNKDANRAKMLAMVIGLNGESLGTAEGKALRELAVGVLQSLARDDKAGARVLADKMIGAKQPTGAAAANIVKFLFDDDPSVKDWDRDLAMQLFKLPRVGGLGTEKKFQDWAAAPPPLQEVNLLVAYAQKAALVGMILERMAPPKNKPPAAWPQEAQRLRSAAVDVMAIDRKDRNALRAAAAKIENACISCHKKYK